jgi:uncharacterized RDD family membrane protein YckC
MTRTNTLQIRTPEGVVFSQRLAGPITRFLAWVVDTVIVGALCFALISLASLFTRLVGEALILTVAILGFFALNLAYSIFCEWRWRGQTLGKRFMRLRVVDAEGLRLKFHQIVVRNLLRAVDMLPGLYLVGGIAFTLSRRAQRLGDLAANTVVVRSPRLPSPNLDLLVSGKFNSFRDHPHLEARLRQRVSTPEASLALQALARRDHLEPAARLELFTALADHFRALVAFPPEATESITDEQYVRNVLDTVYRKIRTTRPTTGSAPSGTTAAHQNPAPASGSPA